MCSMLRDLPAGRQLSPKIAMRNRLILAMLATVGLSGCIATIKPVPLAPTTTPKSWEAELADLQIEPIQGSLTLNEAIARALKYNLDRRAKQIEQEIASGQLETTLQEMLPKATAQLSQLNRSVSRQTWNSDRTGPSGFNSDRNHAVSDLGMSWSLLDFGLGYYNAKQAQERVQIANERRRKLIHSLIQDVRSAYWRAACAQTMREALRTTIAEAELALEDSRQIERERVRAPTEALTYQKQLLDNLRLLELIEQELAPAFVELATLINAPRGQPIVLVADWPRLDATLETPIETLESMALLHNADLREARHHTRIAADETRKTLARMFPNLSFNIANKYDTDSYLVHQSWNEAGLHLSLNLMNLITGPAQLRLAEAGVGLSDQRRMVMQMAVITQVHLGRLNWLNAQKQAARAEQIWTVENRLATLASAREKALMRGRLESVNAQASALLSQFRRYQAISQVQVAESRLRAVLGVEFDDIAIDRVPLDELIIKISASQSIADALRTGTSDATK